MPYRVTCQRCGVGMDLRDPAAGIAWPADQFWVCPQCGRHFWTTYPDPAKAKPAADAPPAKA